jgi:hypothetical protein
VVVRTGVCTGRLRPGLAIMLRQKSNVNKDEFACVEFDLVCSVRVHFLILSAAPLKLNTTRESPKQKDVIVEASREQRRQLSFGKSRVLKVGWHA